VNDTYFEEHDRIIDLENKLTDLEIEFSHALNEINKLRSLNEQLREEVERNQRHTEGFKRKILQK